MNGDDLQCIIESNPCLRQKVKGVFSRTTLPVSVVQYPSVYIVNTDEDDGPGEHWVAIVLTNKGKGVFFDSFGRPPEFYGPELTFFLKSNVDNYFHFKNQVQSKFSTRCGLFVLTFLMLYVCLQWSMDCIEKMFDVHLTVNDSIVIRIVNEYYEWCK